MPRDSLPRASRIPNIWNARQQRYYGFGQFGNNTQENSHVSAEIIVARQLAWIGDQIELRRISAGRAGNVPRSIGRSLAAAGDLLDCRYNAFARRIDSLFRILWRGFSHLEDGGLAFAGAMLRAGYLVIQQVSRNMLL